MNASKKLKAIGVRPMHKSWRSNWIKDKRDCLSASEAQMKVSFNCHMRPKMGLGDVLNLLEKTENDDPIRESVALGPVYSIMRAGSPDFLPCLRDAILNYPSFELSARADMADPTFNRGKGLATLFKEYEKSDGKP